MSNNNEVDQLVSALLDLEPNLDPSALNFLAVSEGEGKLREMLRVLRLVAKLRR